MKIITHRKNAILRTFFSFTKASRMFTKSAWKKKNNDDEKAEIIKNTAQEKSRTNDTYA